MKKLKNEKVMIIFVFEHESYGLTRKRNKYKLSTL